MLMTTNIFDINFSLLVCISSDIYIKPNYNQKKFLIICLKKLALRNYQIWLYNIMIRI